MVGGGLMGVVTRRMRLVAAAVLVIGTGVLDLITGNPALVPLYAGAAWIAGVPGGPIVRLLPLALTALLCLGIGAGLEAAGHDAAWGLRTTSLLVASLPNVRLAFRVRAESSERASLADVYRRRYEYAPIPMTEEDWSGAWRRIAALKTSGVTDLRTHLDRHPDIVRELAGLAVICDVNPAAVRTYRAPSREALIAHFNDTAGYDGASANADIFKHVLCALDAGEEVVTVEGPDLTFDGQAIELRSSTTVVPHTKEPWTFVMQTVENITGVKATENSLRSARDEAEWANTAKSEFLAAMSHEMRTPLNAIIGFGTIMYDEMMGPVGNARYREYAGDIIDSGRHLLRLISDLLDVSRIEAGKMALQAEPLHVEQVLRTSLRLIAGHARSARIELEIRIAEDLPVIQADERRLRQIMLNLLSNALKFTPQEGKVTITLGPWKDGIELVVRDTGIGIADDDLARVTRPFVQSARYLSQHQEGTGLGLAVTQALVNLHGGTMSISSALDKGTEVTIWLPDRVPQTSLLGA